MWSKPPIRDTGCCCPPANCCCPVFADPRTVDALHKQHGIECVVVTLPGTKLMLTGADGDGVHVFARELFDKW